MSARNESEAPYSIISPKGMKYMFATQCSKPAAMKAATGSTMETSLSVKLRPPRVGQTARQTHTLHMMPARNACPVATLLLETA